MTTSWVIIEKATGKPVLETWNPKLPPLINTRKYQVKPIMEYLQSLND